MTHHGRYRIARIGAALLYLAIGAFIAVMLIMLGAALDAP